MKIKFELSYLNFEDTNSQWRDDPQNLDRVLRLMESSGMLDEVKYVSQRRDNPDWTKIETVEMLRELARHWSSNTYLLVSSTQDEPKVEILLGLRTTFLDIKLIVSDFTSAEHVSEIESSINLVEQLHQELEHEALIGPIVHISPPFDLLLSTPCPPRKFAVLNSFSMVDFFCKTYFQNEASEARRQEVEKLLSLKTPEWVERREQGDLVILRWVDRFDDEEHIRERMTRRLVWLIKHLDPPISSNFNEKGDQRANPSVRDDSEGLTIYDPISRHGYKATVCSEDGSVDEALFEQMTQWLQTQETPAGEELCALHLILPSREAALRIRKRAEESGIGRVLYMGQDGNLWDPFPPGDWLEDDYLA